MGYPLVGYPLGGLHLNSFFIGIPPGQGRGASKVCEVVIDGGARREKKLKSQEPKAESQEQKALSYPFTLSRTNASASSFVWIAPSSWASSTAVSSPLKFGPG